MICKTCSVDKPINDFKVHRVINGVSYRRKKCRACNEIVRRKKFNEYQHILQAYKASQGCKVCGVADFRALQFHHRDKSTKLANISEMVKTGASMQNIMTEVVKCDVLCANCHQILHFDERNNQWD